MTRTTRTKFAAVRLARRLTIGVAALATGVGVSLATPAPASAEYAATSSTELASDATHALWLLVRWQDSGELAHYTTYVRARLDAAESMAAALGLSGVALDAEWGAADVDKQHVLLAAMSQLGVPYRSRMSKPGRGFDCSGLVHFAYAQAGIALPRSSGDQIGAARQIDRAALQPGDLVYYPGHVSMYLGDGLVIHSPQPGQEVEVREMYTRSLRFGDATDVQI